MKIKSLSNRTIFLLAILFGSPDLVRAESLFDGPMDPGWYAGPHITISRLNGESAALLGMEACLLANSAWALGIEGSTLISDHDVLYDPDTLRRIELSYFGLKLGVISNSSWLIHWTAGLLIGGGESRIRIPDENSYYAGNMHSSGDGLFVLEPEFGGEVNITDFMRLNASATYRWITWTEERYGVSSQDLSGLGLKFAIRLGRMAPQSSR